MTGKEKINKLDASTIFGLFKVFYRLGEAESQKPINMTDKYIEKLVNDILENVKICEKVEK